MKQYRVAIVEDDKDYSEFLSQCLGKYGLEKEISFSIKTYGKAESFLDDYKKACDVVFMDVELGDGFLNGMEAARVEFYSNYAKYKVMNSYELAYIWEKYNEEKAAREHDSDIAERMDEARRELYQILKHYHINDPSVWVYQPGVLVYDEEAKDIRKQLIVQRQRLKKGIDFEMYNLETAKKELEALVREYPKYAEDIIAVVGEYE